jgi:hypothetical protein
MPDGAFNGMVGDVASGRADLAANDVAFWLQRKQVVDYSVTYDQGAAFFALRKPHETSKILAFLWPLSPTVRTIFFDFFTFFQ